MTKEGPMRHRFSYQRMSDGTIQITMKGPGLISFPGDSDPCYLSRSERASLRAWLQREDDRQDAEDLQEFLHQSELCCHYWEQEGSEEPHYCDRPKGVEHGAKHECFCGRQIPSKGERGTPWTKDPRLSTD